MKINQTVSWITLSEKLMFCFVCSQGLYALFYTKTLQLRVSYWKCQVRVYFRDWSADFSQQRTNFSKIQWATVQFTRRRLHKPFEQWWAVHQSVYSFTTLSLFLSVEALFLCLPRRSLFSGQSDCSCIIFILFVFPFAILRLLNTCPVPVSCVHLILWRQFYGL